MNSIININIDNLWCFKTFVLSMIIDKIYLVIISIWFIISNWTLWEMTSWFAEGFVI